MKKEILNNRGKFNDIIKNPKDFIDQSLTKIVPLDDRIRFINDLEDQAKNKKRRVSSNRINKK